MGNYANRTSYLLLGLIFSQLISLVEYKYRKKCPLKRYARLFGVSIRLIAAWFYLMPLLIYYLGLTSNIVIIALFLFHILLFLALMLAVSGLEDKPRESDDPLPPKKTVFGFSIKQAAIGGAILIALLSCVVLQTAAESRKVLKYHRQDFEEPSDWDITKVFYISYRDIDFYLEHMDDAEKQNWIAAQTNFVCDLKNRTSEVSLALPWEIRIRVYENAAKENDDQFIYRIVDGDWTLVDIK